MAGKRSRGWSLQERAFTPAPEAQAQPSGRVSGSRCGSSNFPQPPLGEGGAADQRSPRAAQREALEAEAPGNMSTSDVAGMATMPRHWDMRDGQRLPAQPDSSQDRQPDADGDTQMAAVRSAGGHPEPLRERSQHQHSRQQHQHQQAPQHPQQPSAQPPVSHQKAILPGVLASLVQTQRSSQRPHPRPPLGPSAPFACRRDGYTERATSDTLCNGAVTSRAGSSGGSGGGGGGNDIPQARATQMPPPAQRRQQQCHARQQQLQQQQRSGLGAKVAPRNLSVQIPVANPVHMQLYSFFSRRRRQLQQLGQRPSRYTRPQQAGPSDGLLALPEDVLLKVICTLRHQEIGNLFGVCKELRATMDTAMMLHFNLLTPHHDQPSHQNSTHGLPPRPGKRSGLCPPSTDPASSAEWDAQPTRRTRPRALLFQDESELSAGTVTGAGSDNDISNPEGGDHPLCTPLTPISIA